MFAACLAVAGLLAGCASLRAFLALDQPVAHLVPQVIAVYPHDPAAFTEGLLLEDGRLYESIGLYGQSELREVDLETGAVLRSVSLPDAFFGEGIALVGDRMLQLTWQEDTALVYDRDTFAQVGALAYSAEGWGMCYDGVAIFTSDGSAEITRRDASTLAARDAVTVMLDGQPVMRINELECIGDSIYANVWYTDNILRIDKASGRVTAVIDASGLLTPEQRAALSRDATFNGIAYDADSGTFLVTGKLWQWLFAVEFVPAPDSAGSGLPG
ncbi:MAG: glutaminyl-peptide cyclotransferase [Anaerolineae bacterium]|nr:glutaminyl-peptide cyclotransferase [Anaerolineae bacterium]